jgi:ribosomal protein S18 acetylase RimI-like enzyme
VTETSRLRPLSDGDIRQAVSLHLSAFRGFYLAALGPRFLRGYYRRVIEYEGGICLGAFDAGQLQGFVAGFIDPPRFYRMLRAARVQLGLAALPALVADPRRVLRFVRNYRQTSLAASATAANDLAAELASLAVDPALEGRGIGGMLVRAFASEAGLRNARSVVLTTDAHGNDAVNHFYTRLGFKLTRTFEAQPGRILNEYAMPIEPRSDRHG